MALLSFIPGLFKRNFICYGYTGCVIQGVLFKTLSVVEIVQRC